MKPIPEERQRVFRLSLRFLLLGALMAVIVLLVDVVGISDPGLGKSQWIALCLAGILIIVGFAMLLAALPDP